MQKEKLKIAIALFLVLTIAVTLIALPIVGAADPPRTWPTVSFLSVSPNPVGVNQSVLIVMWIDKVHPTTSSFWGGRWSGYTVEITKPDNTKETLGPFTADAVASAYTNYSPRQVGTYTVVFKFPEQIVLNTNPPPTWSSFNHPDQINDTYAASQSRPINLVVQEDPILEWSEPALPTGYWTRPITALNRGWAQIAGDWLLGAANPGPDRFDPYLTGPESAHVLWYKSFWEGGIGGGAADVTAYEGAWSTGSGGNPIIINGKAYILERGGSRAMGWMSIDLYTGETLYYQNVTATPSFGSVLTFNSGNGHGVWSYLWTTSGTTWTAIDTFTGNFAYAIANVSSAGTAVYGKDGSILRYNIVGSGANKRLTVWNTTEATSGTYGGQAPRVPNSYSGTYDGNTGFSLNVSIPDVQGDIWQVVEDKYVIGGVAGKQNDTHVEPGHLWKLSLTPGHEGTLISDVTFTPPKAIMDPYQLYQYGPYGPAGWSRTATRMQGPFMYDEEGVFVFWEGATLQLWGFDIETGDMIWGPTEPQTNQFMSFGMVPAVANSILYTGGERGGGEIHAYNITTGESLWEWRPGTTGFETSFGDRPTYINTIADGKLYTTGSEHTPSTPLARDRMISCLNATTGEVIWELSNFQGEQGSFGLSSGYIITNSIYDGRWYCIGKGPSATTVNASPKISVHGSSVMIEGTVTDESPSSPGTPAIADEDQQAWMQYLHMQQTAPADAKGVEVSLDTIDPNNNFVHIATVTSDSSGTFSYKWTPEVPGKYTVIATFAGSKSYGTSYAETTVGVDEAPAESSPPEQTVTSDFTLVYTAIIGGVIAIIIAIAIAVLLLRKR